MNGGLDFNMLFEMIKNRIMTMLNEFNNNKTC